MSFRDFDLMDLIEPPKTTDRNVEKRREKSRDAARSRRSKEADVFTDLSSLVPLTSQQCSNLDKASIMRLAISHLKIRTFVGSNLSSPFTDSLDRLDQQCIRSLHGFLILLSTHGELVYVSEGVQKYLGVNQLEIMGSNMLDFTHPCDHDEIRDILDTYCRASDEPSGKDIKRELSPGRDQAKIGTKVTFSIRFKCTLTQKGRNVNMKAASYKVVRLSGSVVPGPKAGSPSLLMTAEPILHPLYDDIRLDSSSFISRHSLDLQFNHCDQRVQTLLGYSDEDLHGCTLYDYQHAVDAESTLKAFKDLFSKGQSVTEPYRWLVKQGGYCWVQTEASVLYSQKTDKPHGVACLHHVISGVEDEDLILSEVQLAGLGKETRKQFNRVEPKQPSVTEWQQQQQHQEEDDMMDLCQELDGVLLPFSEGDFDGAERQLLHQLYEGLDSSSDLLQGHSGIDMTLQAFQSEPSAEQPPTPNLETLADEVPACSTGGRSPAGATLDPGEEFDLDMRAPFIPMSGSEDLMFATPVDLVEDKASALRFMQGTTESIFHDHGLKEFIQTEPPPLPLNILRQQCMDDMDQQLKGTLCKSSMVPKLPPANETNRLETGPPAAPGQGQCGLGMEPNLLRRIGLDLDLMGSGLDPVPEDEELEVASLCSASMYEISGRSGGKKRKLGASDHNAPMKRFAVDWESDMESTDSEGSLWEQPQISDDTNNACNIPGSSILKALLSKDSHEDYDLTNYKRPKSTKVKPTPPTPPPTPEALGVTTLRGLLTEPMVKLTPRRPSHDKPTVAPPTRITIASAVTPRGNLAAPQHVASKRSSALPPQHQKVIALERRVTTTTPPQQPQETTASGIDALTALRMEPTLSKSVSRVLDPIVTPRLPPGAADADSRMLQWQQDCRGGRRLVINEDVLLALVRNVIQNTQG